MTRRLVLSTAFALALAAGGTTFAEPAPGTGPSGAGITALAWLSGCWRGPAGEECWLEPGRAGMLGVSRGPVDGGEAPSFEFLRIVEDDGALVYLASPGGRCPPTPFRSVEVGEGRVVFANPEHDFPQRITYRLEGGDTLHARVEAEEDGEMRGFELVWKRGSWDGD
jgi:hypothetical protein